MTWPFATTLWEYISRAMPRGREGSLQPDEVYSLTAFLLHANGVTGESDVMDLQSLPKVEMPNRTRFVAPKPGWQAREKRPFGMY
jgi:cytochrome c